jgi:hypothetical protein
MMDRRPLLTSLVGVLPAPIAAAAQQAAKIARMPRTPVHPPTAVSQPPPAPEPSFKCLENAVEADEVV